MSTTLETGEKLYTAEDLLTMPKGFELVRGKLVGGPTNQMANNPLHARLSVRLGSILDRYSEGYEHIVVLSECGFIIGRNPDTLRAPDIAVVSKVRFEAAVAEQGYFKGAPDLAIEVLSPSNSSEDMDLKLFEYFDAGVQEVWTVGIRRRGIAVYRASGGPKFYRREDTLESGEILPGFVLPLVKLFPD